MVGLGFGSRANKNACRPETMTENKVKVFYEGPDFDSDGSDSEWVEDLEPPSLLSRAIRAMKKKSKSNAAIELYKRRSDGDDDKLYIEKVRFDVRPLRDALEGVLEPDSITYYYSDDDTAVSISPHSALYFARHRITELSKMSDDDEVRRRCSLLRDVIQEIFLDKFEEIEALNREGAITYELMWTLFPPRGIYGVGANPPRALRVNAYKQDHWKATVENEIVMFGGYCFITRYIDNIIPRFPGKMELSKLLPGGQPYLDLQQDNGKLREQLIERGRKALDFQTARYMLYKPGSDGDGQSLNPWLAGQSPQRVMCDCYMNRRAIVEPPSPPAPIGAPGAPRPHIVPNMVLPKPIKFYELPGYKNTSMLPMRFCRPTPVEMEINRQVATESDENLLVMSPFVPSFNLDNNTWFDAEIDRLEPITQPDETVLDRVTFDEDKKEILKTLVESHKQFGGDQDDLIARKGRALVIILEGDHGTGKKHIIKALAEQLACPLMRGPNRYLTAGPNIRLPHLLEQAAEWGALLMFDDPDFLAKSGGGPWAGPMVSHTTRDLQDFLRRVEFFKGIIFLTTDRQKDQINSSILSRADAHFTFPVFNKEESKQVWKTFLDRLPDDIGRNLPITSEELAAKMAAKWSMNGHEIKHVVNLTTTWCCKKNRPLDQEILEEMIETTCPSAMKVAAKKPPRDLDYIY